VIAAAAVLAALVLAGLLAPALAPYDPARQLDLVALQNRPPSAAHPFGTDPYARDVLSRVLHATRTSLGVAALGALVATTVGAAWGAAAGAAGGTLDRLLMRLVDVALGVPRVLLLLAVVALWGNVPAATLAVLLGLTAWPGTSRLVRARVAQVRAEEFVAAARASAPRPHASSRGTCRPTSPARSPCRGRSSSPSCSPSRPGSRSSGSASAAGGELGEHGAGRQRRTCSTPGGPPRCRTACVVASVLAATALGDASPTRARPRRGG
jgi:hypothetical protein